MGEAIEAEAGREVSQGGGDDACDAIGPPAVDLDKGDHEDVGQRQPHGAELREAWDAGIEDTAGDVEMGDRVAVVEQRVVTPAPGDGDE